MESAHKSYAIALFDLALEANKVEVYQEEVKAISNILKENKLIAETITNTMKKNLNNIRDVKQENSYYMYSKLKVPGILVEAGFISNKNDNYKIRQEDYQDILINNIFDTGVDIIVTNVNN